MFASLLFVCIWGKGVLFFYNVVVFSSLLVLFNFVCEFTLSMCSNMSFIWFFVSLFVQEALSEYQEAALQ